MTVSLCITGWYLNLKTYQQIKKLQGVSSFYVVAHKKDPLFKQRIEKLGFTVFEKENKGWDWGAYQQWLSLGLWKKYQFSFFIHDDINIKRFDLINHCVRTLQNKDINVIGNSKNARGKQDWEKTHPQCYQHSTWKPPKGFKHLTVRGSFFGLPKKTLKALDGKFEINWSNENIRIGNHSLIATCGKIAHLLGNKFHYLGNELNTEFLEEFSKGKRQPTKYTKPNPPKPQKPNKESPKITEPIKEAANLNKNKKNDGKITIVSSNFNTVRFMQLLEKSLIKNTENPFKFLIATRSQENIKLEKAEVLQFELAVNKGSQHHGAVLNKLVSLVESEYTLIIDADCLVCKKGWDTKFIKLLEKYRLIGARAFRSDKKTNTKMLHANFIFGKTGDLQNDIDYRPNFNNNVDTAGKISLSLKDSPILHIDFRNPTMIFGGIKCAEYFLGNEPLWYHFGRGGNSRKNSYKQKWYKAAEKYLGGTK